MLYITRDLGAPQTAPNLEQALRGEIKSLAEMPKRIKTVDKKPWKDEGVRRMLVKNYFVYFVVGDETTTVRVTAVIYAGRDEERQMTERKKVKTRFFHPRCKYLFRGTFGSGIQYIFLA